MSSEFCRNDLSRIKYSYVTHSIQSNMVYLLIIFDEYKASVSVNTELHSIIEYWLNIAVIHFDACKYLSVISHLFYIYLFFCFIYFRNFIDQKEYRIFNNLHLASVILSCLSKYKSGWYLINSVNFVPSWNSSQSQTRTFIEITTRVWKAWKW